MHFLKYTNKFRFNNNLFTCSFALVRGIYTETQIEINHTVISILFG